MASFYEPPDWTRNFREGQQMELQRQQLQQRREEFSVETQLRLEEHKNQQQKIAADILNKVSQQSLDAQTQLGFAELNKVMANANTLGGWASPEFQNQFFSVAAKYPQVSMSPQFSNYRQLMDNASKLEAAKIRTKPPTDAEKIIDLRQQIRTAESSGDTQLAEDLKGRLALATSRGQKITRVTDPATGNVIMETIEGGSPAGSADPTIATKTRYQQDLTETGTLFKDMVDLQSQIRPEDLGVRGVIGEHLMDRLVSQFVPGASDAKRGENRSKLGLVIAGMVKKLSAPPVSDREVKQLKEIIPSNGVFESYEHFQASLKALQEFARTQARSKSKALGTPTPEWALTQDEIREQFKAGKIDREDALMLFRRYHGAK